MSLGKVPVKLGGGVMQNESLELGAQVSTATQRAETTTTNHHTEKLRGDTCKPLYSQMLTKEKGRGRRQLRHKSKIWSSKQLQNFPERVHII